MTVSRIASAAGPSSRTKENAKRDVPAQEPVLTRALVPIEPAERISVLRPARPEASFVAHLIATAEHAPQTRALRQATPAAAQAMYDRATVTSTNCYGKILSQIA